MMEIIYNSDNLTHEDITDVSVRTKALIIRDNEILLLSGPNKKCGYHNEIKK